MSATDMQLHRLLTPGSAAIRTLDPRQSSGRPDLIQRQRQRRLAQRLTVNALLVVIMAIQAWLVTTHRIPAHGGTDQNGYLVTARLMVEKQSLHFLPPDPFQFAGNMMIRTDDGRIFAKYPPGFPMLAAIGRLLGKTDGMYWVNPVCTVLASIVSFFLFRLLLSDFTSLLGVLWLAWNPLVLCYANDSNSHASTLLCVTLGAWGLLSWLQGRSRWRGMLGAFALGFAATIRYTEALLLLPVLFVVLCNLHFTWKSIRDAAWVFLSWAIPVGALAITCWVCFGLPWKTGYSFCAEDTGFAWKYFWGNSGVNHLGHWETLLIQMNWIGLFILWPLGAIGMVGLLGHHWRLAMAMILWVVPPVVLHLFYYWAPEGEASLGYLRFFISVLPALILAGLWLLERGLRSGHWSAALALGLITALGMSVNLGNILPNLESDYFRKVVLHDAAGFVQAAIPQGSVIFLGDEPLSNHLDAVGGYTLYNFQLFTNSDFSNFDRIIEDKDRELEPDPRQRARTQLYLNLMAKKASDGTWVPRSNEELRQVEHTIMEQYLRQGKRVMVILRTGQNSDLLPQRPGWQTNLLATKSFFPVPNLGTRPIGGWKLRGRAGLGESFLGKPVTWTIFEVVPS